MKKIFIILFISLLCLTACSSQKTDYEKEDVENTSSEIEENADYINELILNGINDEIVMENGQKKIFLDGNTVTANFFTDGEYPGDSQWDFLNYKPYKFKINNPTDKTLRYYVNLVQESSDFTKDLAYYEDYYLIKTYYKDPNGEVKSVGVPYEFEDYLEVKNGSMFYKGDIKPGETVEIGEFYVVILHNFKEGIDQKGKNALFHLAVYAEESDGSEIIYPNW